MGLGGLAQRAQLPHYTWAASPAGPHCRSVPTGAFPSRGQSPIPAAPSPAPCGRRPHPSTAPSLGLRPPPSFFAVPDLGGRRPQPRSRAAPFAATAPRLTSPGPAPPGHRPRPPRPPSPSPHPPPLLCSPPPVGPHPPSVGARGSGGSAQRARRGSAQRRRKERARSAQRRGGAAGSGCGRRRGLRPRRSGRAARRGRGRSLEEPSAAAAAAAVRPARPRSAPLLSALRPGPAQRPARPRAQVRPRRADVYRGGPPRGSR